jgi:hypothetical protein
MRRTLSRHFVIVAPPSETAWIGKALREAFACPEGLPTRFETLIGRLDEAG